MIVIQQLESFYLVNNNRNPVEIDEDSMKKALEKLRKKYD